MMKPTYPTNLRRSLVRFFQDYLPAQRGMSAHTIRSYRDAIVLFLRFATQHTGRPVESFEVGDLRPDRVTMPGVNYSERSASIILSGAVEEVH